MIWFLISAPSWGPLTHSRPCLEAFRQEQVAVCSEVPDHLCSRTALGPLPPSHPSLGFSGASEQNHLKLEEALAEQDGAGKANAFQLLLSQLQYLHLSCAVSTLIFWNQNIPPLSLAYFLQLNEVLKGGMILREFNYQIIGQVIRTGNEQNNERLENGSLNARVAEECISQTPDIQRLSCLFQALCLPCPSIAHWKATAGSVYRTLFDLYKTSLFFSSFVILLW